MNNDPEAVPAWNDVPGISPGDWAHLCTHVPSLGVSILGAALTHSDSFAVGALLYTQGSLYSTLQTKGPSSALSRHRGT